MVYLEHKLLADYWLEYLGGSLRADVEFDIPAAGAEGPVPKRWEPLPIGRAAVRREGDDVAIVSVGVGVHRALEASERLVGHGIETLVIDLLSVAPLDREAVLDAARRTGRLLVVDEDYEAFGLSGEIAAIAAEKGLRFRFARVCTKRTIPFARTLEEAALPNVGQIIAAAVELVGRDA